MTGKGSKNKDSGGIDANDAKLLEQAFADVAPLPGRTVRPGAEPAKPKPKPRAAPPDRRTRDPATSEFPELRAGDAPGVDKKTQQKMRRGQVEIEGRLDLHGMYQDEAVHGARAISRPFPGGGQEMRPGDHRQGNPPPDGPGRERIGVLRRAVPGWLNRAGLRERIQGFREAAPSHGGSGASTSFCGAPNDPLRRPGAGTPRQARHPAQENGPPISRCRRPISRPSNTASGAGPGPGFVMQIANYFELIWDEVDELKELARLSHPRVPVETGGLSPKATLLANLMARHISELDDATIERILAEMGFDEVAGEKS